MYSPRPVHPHYAAPPGLLVANHDVLLLDGDGHVPDHAELGERLDVVQHECQLVRDDEVDGDLVRDGHVWPLSCADMFDIRDDHWSGSTSVQTSAPSSGSSGSTATSTSDGSTSSSDAQTSAESSSPPSSTTFLLQSTETTVVGGSTVTTQITSLEVVAVTASSTLAASLPSGSSTSSDSAPTGAIIGAIIGGIAALVLLAFGFAFFSRGKKRPDDVQEKDPEPDMTTLASRMLRKRRDKKGDIDIDAEARPFTEGLPYQLGDISVNTIPPTPPQKDLPMRFASKLKPLPKSPRATWYSVVPSKSPPPDQSDRSSIATIRATPRATPASQPLPQLTVNPPSPRLPMLHVSNVSPRNSALLTPPPLPEKSHFLPRPRNGRASSASATPTRAWSTCRPATGPWIGSATSPIAQRCNHDLPLDYHDDWYVKNYDRWHGVSKQSIGLIQDLIQGRRAAKSGIVYLEDDHYEFCAKPDGRKWTVYGSPVSA
ncbi:hypothetical protein EVJ58_g10351 [Rhodofomes roseus]|uniref:Uncharacterized protein n=1 Tax=Rhodofomes roseus TaxID=34475 RepID=A0A4Y9XPZ1_9APHY|nr:hypothetical protein EVJ58_g10351 [Rhodofomes roseus]